MENHMSDGTKWDDAELMDTKDIFIKMMDFIRNYVRAHHMFSRILNFFQEKVVFLTRNNSYIGIL